MGDPASRDDGTLTGWLERRAESGPERRLFSFLEVDGREREAYTYGTFLDHTRELAGHLSRHAGLRNGDRVLLVYPPGLEIITAFYACARIGVIAVPVYPPSPMSFEAGLAKLTYVARDCEARAALTTRGFYRSYRLLLAKRRFSALWKATPDLPDLEWVTTDDARGSGAGAAPHDPHDILFLQYTSGSTSDPKGVIVSHENVIANAHSTLQHRPVGVTWLPQYHDMGFIGYYMYSVIKGGEAHGFSPLDFLKRPALWFEAMTRFRATITSAPNFAYDYCLRTDKVPDEVLEGVDLESLEIMMNAAEPVRAESFRRFRERFEPYGLRPQAFMAAFGLAENTLAVSLHGKRTVTVNKQFLQQGKLHFETPEARNLNQCEIVSCGPPLPGVDVRIVDPDAAVGLGEGRIGEIWLAGKSKCAGYWNRDELSRETFGCAISGDDVPGRTWLRTGDLGFLREGELYVCGRVKDMIIVRGVNYYPQDIEAIVEAAAPGVRKGCVAAFSVDLDGEALVVVAEVKDEKRLPDSSAIAQAIRTQYYIEPHTIAFIKRRAIPKTTSGKISRSRVREAWLREELPVLSSHVRTGEGTADLSGLRERFRYIVEVYNLTGQEEFTFAEIGIDSLTMVNLIGDIKDLMVEHGAGELVEHVDIRLLQKLTVAQFFGLLDHFEKGPEEPLEALGDLLRYVHEEYDAHERECMKVDTRLSLPSVGEAPASRETSNVLLTGATGFFGPFLLSSLLRKTPHRYSVLVRATDPIHGKERLRNAMRRARVLTPAIEADLEERVGIVCGDLGRDRLGLPTARWDALSSDVDAVCHNGALVNYVLSYEALRPHNVDGTRELLRLAASGRKKTFHLVSSTFIFGWSPKKVLWETDHNAEMAHLDFGYAQTKWVAEQLVFAAEKQGLDVRIYRPSLISASSGGVGSRDDIAIRLLAFMIRYGVAVEALNQISFLPADVVADNIAALFGLPRTNGNTFHITADEYYSLVDVARTMTRLYGYEFRYYDIPEFLEKMNELCTQDDLLYPLLDFFNRSHRKIEAMKEKRYDNAHYREARVEAGSKGGDPPLDAIVSFIVEYMKRDGLIEPREARRGAAAYGAPPDASAAGPAV